MISFPIKPLAAGALFLGGTGVATSGAMAQASYFPPGATVQSLKEDPAEALTRHLRALNSAPRNLSSLLGAGQAALEVGDPQTALTFFARAEEVAPRDGRVKAGMGSAFVHTEQAQAALRFFAEAVQFGAPLALFAKDRGLAFDMIGDQARAQADYAFALQSGRDPEVERRLALSKAVGGDQKGALAILDPQIRSGDRAGWRARAFVLALTGDAQAAVQAARSVMPAQANAMSPFFARLPQLSAADRAMAVHFGRFPSDRPLASASLVPEAVPAQLQPASPRVANVPVANVSASVPVSSFPVANVPVASLPVASPPVAGPGLSAPGFGAQATSAGRPDPAQPAFGNAAVNVLFGRPAESASAAPAQAIAVGTRTAASAPIPIAVGTRTAASVPIPVAVAPAPAAPAPVEIAALPQSILQPPIAPAPSSEGQASSRQPSPAAAPAQDLDGLDFTDVVEAIQSLPATAEEAQPEAAKAEPAPKEPAPDKEPAKKETPKKEVPKKEAAKKEPAKKEAAKPAEPSRIWVQVAAAQDKSAFPAEFKRLSARASAALSGKSAWTAPMGRTNRLLVGPFKTQKEALEFVNQLSKAKISSFSWVSDAGQKVDKVPAR